MMLVCKLSQPVLNIPAGGLNMDIFNPHRNNINKKIIIVMGATGAGKSRLSIDLATRFPAEIINSDKMQVYEGLDIVTNKITDEERCGIPHHLLGKINPNSDFTAKDFCDKASLAIGSIQSRNNLPIIVGGSNSFIEALVNDEATKFRSKYEFCFLWVDVSMPILYSFVSKRVDHMIANGMIEEARNFFDASNKDYSRGIRRAIGLPEFDKFFREEKYSDDKTRARLLQEAICEIKSNTCKLACRQWEKIYRLQKLKGWKMHRVEATDVFRKHGREADEAWEKLVAGPSTVIVRKFLYNIVAEDVPPIRAAAMGAALVAARHQRLERAR